MGLANDGRWRRIGEEILRGVATMVVVTTLAWLGGQAARVPALGWVVMVSAVGSFLVGALLLRRFGSWLMAIASIPRRVAKCELLTTGYSPALPEVPVARYSRKKTPYSSFQYRPTSLDDKHRRGIQEVQDPLAIGGLASEAAEERWCIFGPYVRLPRDGRYIAVFRVRCARGNGCVYFDVTHRSDADSKAGKPFDGPLSHGSAPMAEGDHYVPVVLEFAYRGQPDVEFRVDPHHQASGITVRVDRVSILWVGRL